MLIRPFHVSDTPQVISLWQDCFGYPTAHNDPATLIRQKLALQRELFFVAIVNDELAGTVMGGYDGHRGWIYSLVVKPKFRRQSIGADLVRHVERALVQLGCLKVNLQILASNSDVVKFYEKLGFKVEERISMGKVL